MLGFLIGTVCLVGLIKTLRWGRHGGGGCGYGRGYGHHGGGWGRRGWGGGDGEHGDHGGSGGGWGGRGFGGPNVFMRMLFQRLETTPGQEKVIVAAYEEMREAAQKARGELKASRGDVAKAMRSESIDEVFFGEMFARHDTALEALRKASLGAVAKVHDALDEKQRARFADLIESGPAGFRGRSWNDHAYQV
jgi:hypothetical protein